MNVQNVKLQLDSWMMVNKMKINRTFCLDVDVARELKKRSNQSYLVNQLVKKHLFDDLISPTIDSMSNRQIAAALHARIDDLYLKEILLVYITQGKSGKHA